MREIFDRLMPDYIEFLASLVRAGSEFGREGAAQQLVEARMEKLGLAVERVYSRQDADAVNLAGLLPGTDSENYRSLILNAHCDIAPVDAPSRWKRDPFSGEVLNGTMYGRGCLDDKAGIAIILMVVNALRHLDTRLPGDIIVQSVIEDETTGNGSKALIAKGFAADGVIICDGTWPERIINAHFGQLSLEILIEGEPVAACVEQRGTNPVYVAMELIATLRQAISAWNENAAPQTATLKPFFINIGSLHAGAWFGSVPAEVRMEVQIGFQDSTPEAVFERVRAVATGVSDAITVSQGLLKVAPYYTDPDGPFISELKAIIEANSGKEVRMVNVTGHCDMQYFGTPHVCLYGPGGGERPHAVDEIYFLDHMPIVAGNILEFAIAWCGRRR